MDGGKIGSFILVIIIVGGIAYWQFSKQGDKSDEMYNEAIAIAQMLDTYPENEQLFLDALEVAHEDSFSRHYKMRGRRRASSFNEHEYWAELYAMMAVQLRDAGCEPCGLEYVELFKAHTGRDIDGEP